MVLGNLHDWLDRIEKIAESRRKAEGQKNLERVVLAIYNLGNEGSTSVSLSQIESELGTLATPTQIVDAIHEADARGFLKSVATLNDPDSWLLSLNGRRWAKAVLRELGLV